MSESIVQGIMPGDPDARCWLCGSTRELERHHAFPGNPNRKLSEQDGCWLYLCHHCHHDIVHAHRELAMQDGPIDAMELVQRATQLMWMHRNGKTEDDFRARYGRSWL